MFTKDFRFQFRAPLVGILVLGVQAMQTKPNHIKLYTNTKKTALKHINLQLRIFPYYLIVMSGSTNQDAVLENMAVKFLIQST